MLQRRAGFTPRSLNGCPSPTSANPSAIPDASFDFVLCNAVIQHIAPDIVFGVPLPELARLLKSRGRAPASCSRVGTGIATVYDKDYGADRTFQLLQRK